MVFCVFTANSAILALLGSQLSRGRWLEHITLIDLCEHDRAGIAKISSLMMFAMAFGFSVAAILSFWGSILTVVLALLAIIVAVSLIGYIGMARAPKASA